MRRFWLPLAVLAGLAVAGAVLLAVGRTPSAASAVSRAAARTVDAGTTRIAFTSKQGPELRQGTGALDFRTHRGWFALGGSTYAIFDGPILYVRAAELDLLTSKHWLRFPADGDSTPFGTPAADPAKLFRFVRSGARDIRKVGQETIGGVATTRYDGTIGPNHLDLSNASFSVWIDGDGLARRLRVLDRTEDPPSTLTLEFSDFGAPVTVDVPAQNDVLTAAELEQLFEQQAAKSDGDCAQGELCVYRKATVKAK
jgi:hypothetical protein